MLDGWLPVCSFENICINKYLKKTGFQSLIQKEPTIFFFCGVLNNVTQVIVVPGGTNAMGEPDYGHAGVSSTGHGDAHARPAAAQALRPHQTPDQPHHDEEHPGTGHLPAVHHILTAVCRSVYRVSSLETSNYTDFCDERKASGHLSNLSLQKKILL